MSGDPVEVTVKACCRRTARSTSSASSTRVSNFALLEGMSIRLQSSGMVGVEPCRQIANRPTGWSGSLRSLMLWVISAHSSTIWAV